MKTKYKYFHFSRDSRARTAVTQTMAPRSGRLYEDTVTHTMAPRSGRLYEDTVTHTMAPRSGRLYEENNDLVSFHSFSTTL